MSQTIPEFWKLLIESRLLTPEQCQALGVEFGRVKGAAAQGNVKTLVQWLISQNAITQYQATILQAGRSGPFHYGDYRVYDRISEGRLSGMFRAIHDPTNHLVLLQFVTGAASQDAESWSELVEHIQSRCELVDPYLTRCYEAVDLGSYKFVVIEDLRGQSLDGRLSPSRPLRPNDACRAARAAALALLAIHQAGQVHGDVRPHNLWLDGQGFIKLVRDPLLVPSPSDFSQASDSSSLLTRADYAAPELANPNKEPDVLTDIYALGCTLYHLLTGQPPFGEGDVSAKLQQHASKPIKPLEQFGLPTQLGQLVAYMMAKNPAIRYQEANVIAQQIEPFIDSAQLNLQPQMSQTLPAYEKSIRERQHELPAPSAPPQSSFPSFEPSRGGGTATAVASTPKVVSGSAVVASSPASSRVPTPVSAPSAKGTSTSSATERFQRRRSKKQWIMLGAGLGGSTVLILLIALGIFIFGGSTEITAPDDDGAPTDDGSAVATNTDGGSNAVTTTSNGNASGDGSGGTSSTVESHIVEIADDGETLWAPPTVGSPITFEYVPKGRMYLIVRPADILDESDGEEILNALGPKLAAAQSQWERDAGFLLPNIEQLVIGLHENNGNMPRPSFRVRLAQPVADTELLNRWGNPPAEAAGEQKIYNAASGWSFFVPPPGEDGNVRYFVMGSKPEVSDVAATGATEPLLMRDLKDLLAASDDSRHVTVLAARIALINEEGQKLFSNEWAKVRDPLDWFIGDSCQAAMLSMHFGDYFYVEMRMKGHLGMNEFTLASDLRDRLEQVPPSIESYIDSINPPEYWKRLARRFPLMIQEMHKYTRVGVEDGHAVINSVMEPRAAPNMLAATELAIATGPGYRPPTTVVNEKPQPKTIEELLAEKIDYSVPSADMINVMSELEELILDIYKNLPFKLRIKIIGPDLEDSSITQNQRINDFDAKQKPIAEILTGLVRIANPTPNVSDPSDEEQKLIWVVGPDPDSGENIILITTRKAAGQKNYELPAPFKPKSG